MNPQVCQKEGEMQSATNRQNGLQARYRSLLFPMLLLICLVPLGTAQNMVNVPVDPANRVALKGHQPAWANAQNDQGSVPADLKLEALTIVLNRPPKVEAAYTQLLEDQQNPKSPNYHHWLTPVETGQRFGATAHDIDAVTGWLQTQGLTVDSVSNSKVRITFSGTAASVANAFGGEMHYFQVGEEKRISLTSAPQIPAALSAVIRVVSGLSTVHLYPQHHVSSDIGLSPDGTFTCGGGVECNFIFPGDFATIYNLKGITGGITGAGQTIAIIGRSQVCASDITGFTTIAAIPVISPTLVVPTTGNPPAAAVCTGNTSGDQQEATLDITRSGSVAPGAAIKLVASGGVTNGADGVDIATQYVVDTSSVGATIMSISFGSCETSSGFVYVPLYNGLFQQAAGEGISVFVSAGDSGAAGCDASFQPPPASQVLSPNSICASSYATCVGGTEFADASNPSQYWSGMNGTGFSSALSYIPEGAWNEPGTASPFTVAGTGGGVSGFIATPSWQTGTGVPSARTGRYTPDVAFSASGHDGYFACLAANGACSMTTLNGVVFFEGTSAAAPDMAGIAALLNQSQGSAQGLLNPNLYTLAATPTNGVFNDVTVSSSAVSGCVVTTPSMCNNSTPSLTTGLTPGFSGYLIGTGYDEATGLGSINVANLLANWGPAGTTPSQTTLQTSAATIPFTSSSSVTFTATAAPASGTGMPTGRVTFFNGTSTLGTASLSNGTATFIWLPKSAGSYSITAKYLGDSTYAGSTSSGLTQEVVDVLVTGTSTLAVSSGSSGTVTFTVTPTPGTGFAPSVQMTCSVSPALAGCALSPASFTANGATTSTLTITAVQPGTTMRMVPPGMFLLLGSLLPLGGLVRLRRKRGSTRWTGLGLVVTLSVFTLWLAGCGGGGSNNNTPKGSYTVTVTTTATSGAITINPIPAMVSLTVQ
jgi:subtilase family serine protease